MSPLLPVVILLIVGLLVLRAVELSGFATVRDSLRLLLEEARRLIVMLSIFGVRRLSRLQLGRDASCLLRELRHRIVVHSAETVQGREAEFINDSLPKRSPILLGVFAVLLLAALTWLSR